MTDPNVPGGSPVPPPPPPPQQRPPAPPQARPPAAAARPARGGFSGRAVFGASLASALLAAVIVALVFTLAGGRGGEDDVAGDFAEAATAKASPCVVNVSMEEEVFNPNSGEREVTALGVGSGVIISEDGYILTNNHVVEGADDLYVTIGVEDVPARLVGRDPLSDLAVVKVDEVDLPAIEIGSSAELEVGTPVVAIGNPQGLGRSVSAGVVSALGRTQLMEGEESFTSYVGAIQHDAAVNPGNSGGALCDAQGRLVGINSMIVSASGMLGSEYAQSAGLSFAIPIDYAMGIANQIIETGKATHPYLGVLPETVDRSTAVYYDLPAEHGALVSEVIEGSPAEDAGLQAGDLVVEIAGATIKTAEDLYGAVQSKAVGEDIEVRFWRLDSDASDGDEEMSVTVTLGSDEDVR